MHVLSSVVSNQTQDLLLSSENNKILGKDTVSSHLTWKTKIITKRNISPVASTISSIF